MPRVWIACAAVVVAMWFPAQAQETKQPVREQIIIREGSGARTPPSGEPTVRVQSSVNLFMPAPTSEGEALEQWRDRARKTMYQMAARECAMLEDVLAKTCRLESITVNLQRQPGMGAGDGYMLGGNFTMAVTLK